MKALIAREPEKPEIIEVKRPVCGPRDIIAKVNYAGICATDIAIITGKTMFVKTGQVKYPVRIGHEWCGTVVETGSEVQNLKTGDKVVGDNGVPCFSCPECLSGNLAGCPNTRSVGTINTYDGCFAEYMKMPAALTYKLPDDVNMKSAALIEPASIAMAGIKKLDIKAGETVMVIGTGAIGLTGVALLKACGARVVLVGRRDSKLAYGAKVGADYLINNKEKDVSAELKKIDPRGKVDALLETSGNAEVLNETYKYVISRGKIGLAGFFEQRIDGFDIDQFVLAAVDLCGVAGCLGVMKDVIRLMEQGKVDFSPLVTSIYPFDDALKAVSHVIENDGNRIKVLLEF